MRRRALSRWIDPHEKRFDSRRRSHRGDLRARYDFLSGLLLSRSDSLRWRNRPLVPVLAHREPPASLCIAPETEVRDALHVSRYVRILVEAALKPWGQKISVILLLPEEGAPELAVTTSLPASYQD